MQEHFLFPLSWLSKISKGDTSNEDMLRQRDIRYTVAVDVTDTLMSLWLIYDYNVGLKDDDFVIKDLRASIAQYKEPSLDEIDEAWQSEDSGQNRSVTDFSQLFNPENPFDLGKICSDIGSWNASTGLIKSIQELLPGNSYLNGSSMRLKSDPSHPYVEIPYPYLLPKVKSPLELEVSPDRQLSGELKGAQALPEPLLSEGTEIRDLINARLVKQYRILEDLNRIFNHDLGLRKYNHDDLSIDTRAYERVIKALGQHLSSADRAHLRRFRQSLEKFSNC